MKIIILFEEQRFLAGEKQFCKRWYIGHAVVELLVQERVVSMFSVIDILERRLQSGDSSKDEFMEILEAIEKLLGYV